MTHTAPRVNIQPIEVNLIRKGGAMIIWKGDVTTVRKGDVTTVRRKGDATIVQKDDAMIVRKGDTMVGRNGERIMKNGGMMGTRNGDTMGMENGDMMIATVSTSIKRMLRRVRQGNPLCPDATSSIPSITDTSHLIILLRTTITVNTSVHNLAATTRNRQRILPIITHHPTCSTRNRRHRRPICSH